MTFAHAGSLLNLFAQVKNNGADDGALAGLMAFLVGYLVFIAVIFVITAIGKWKVFTKAGQPGWAAIIPFYDFFVMTQIAKKEILWFVLYLIGLFICGPLALVALFVVNVEIASKFGKGTGYGIGLTLLPFIFYPLLGFSDARYRAGKSKAIRDFDDEDEEEEDEEEDEDDRPRRRR